MRAKGLAVELIGNAIKTLYPQYFPKIQKIEKQDEEASYDGIVSWFFNNSDDFELLDEQNESEYTGILNKIKPLQKFVKEYVSDVNDQDIFFWEEFVLWGLVEFKKLSKYRYAEGVQFKDPYGSFISGL